MTALRCLPALTVAALGLASPATATITITTDTTSNPAAIGQAIAFIPPRTGSTIQGATVGSNVAFNFATSTPGEMLIGQDNVVRAVDGFLDNVGLGPADPDIGFTQAFLRIGSFSSPPYTVFAVDQFGRAFSATFSPGLDLISVRASDGQLITRVGYTASPGGPGAVIGLSPTFIVGLTSITSPVPEPATWVMILSGFAAVGYALRRRPRSRAVGAR